MKKIIVSAVCLSAVTAVFADGTNQLVDEKSRVSYAIGMNLGSEFKQDHVDVDDALLLRGLQDYQSGQTQFSEADMRKVLTEFQSNLRAKQQQHMAEVGVTNKAAGQAFLAANKNKPGVKLLPVTLPDGKIYEEQYLVITNGSGEIPAANDTVTANFRGTFIDGKEFDSSYSTGKPVTFPLSAIPIGWRAAMQKMPAGSHWKLFIPPELAYGESGYVTIPPNSTLIFDVDLVSVQKAPPPPPPPAPLTSDIIKVPSAEEMKKGAKIETIKAEDVQKMQQQQPGK